MGWLLLTAVGRATEEFSKLKKKTPYFEIVCIYIHVYTRMRMCVDT